MKDPKMPGHVALLLGPGSVPNSNCYFAVLVMSCICSNCYCSITRGALHLEAVPGIQPFVLLSPPLDFVLPRLSIVGGALLGPLLRQGEFPAVPVEPESKWITDLRGNLKPL